MAVLEAGLVERERELALLSDIAAAVDSGRARLVLLTGEAGIGKSALSRALAARLQPTWHVELVGGHRTDRSFSAPFGHLAGELADDQPPAVALAAMVASACASRRGDRPLLLVVEDLHLVDPVAIPALPNLLNAVFHEPILVLATYRLGSHPVGAAHTRALAELLRHPSASELRLSPLSVEGVSGMVLALGGDPEQLGLRELYHRTAGNPFFVEALVRSGGVLDAVPWTVAETILAVFDTLPPSALAVAEGLALEGAPISERVAAALTPEWRAGVLALCDCRLAEHEAGTVRLRHALVAEALLERLNTAERTDRHRWLAEALEVSGDANAESLARHWAAAGQLPRAAPWAALAADKLALAGSHERAAELYELALARPSSSPAERSALLERAATAAAFAGHHERARAWGSLGQEARLASRQSLQALGGWVNAVFLRKVDDTSGRDRDDESLATLVAEAQMAVDAGDLERAERLALGSLGFAAADSDGTMRSNAALVLAYVGNFEVARRVMLQVIEEAERRADWGTLAAMRSRLGRMFWMMGSIHTAIDHTVRGFDVGQRVGDPTVTAHLGLSIAFLQADGGMIGEAEQRCEHAEKLDAPVVVEMAKAVRSIIAMERGELDEGARMMGSIVPVARALGLPYFTVPALVLLARVQLLSGDVAGATMTLEEADGLRWSPYHEVTTDLLLNRAVVASITRDRTAGQLAANGLAELAVVVGGPNMKGGTCFADGLLAVADRNHAEAATAFEAAAAAWFETPRFALAAEALCAAAEAAPAVDLARAVADAERALSLAEDHGLSRVAWRAATFLGRVGRPVDSLHAGEAGTSLTDRERQLVELVAAGHTNKEIAAALSLSEKTVRNYLSTAFTKLGVTRRSELYATRAPHGPR